MIYVLSLAGGVESNGDLSECGVEGPCAFECAVVREDECTGGCKGLKVGVTETSAEDVSHL